MMEWGKFSEIETAHKKTTVLYCSQMRTMCIRFIHEGL